MSRAATRSKRTVVVRKRSMLSTFVAGAVRSDEDGQITQSEIHPGQRSEVASLDAGQPSFHDHPLSVRGNRSDAIGTRDDDALVEDPRGARAA